MDTAAHLPRPDVRERFLELSSRADADIDLSLGAALIAAEEYPGLEVTEIMGELERLAEAVRGRLSTTSDPQARLRSLTSFLHDELGLCGNSDDYYDPKNSFINDVLQRRVGIPITLAVIY